MGSWQDILWEAGLPNLHWIDSHGKMVAQQHLQSKLLIQVKDRLITSASSEGSV